MTRLYAATGDAIAILDEVGGAWTARTSLAGSGAQCLAVDPRAPAVLYAGCRSRGAWKSEDGGAAWRDLGLPQLDVFSVAVSAADGTVYAGCEPSMLFRSADGGETWEELAALRGIPSAPTWSFPPRPWTSHVRSIAPSPHDPGVLLAGIELGGLMRSGDGGRTWEDHRPGAQRDVHSLAWHPSAPGRAYEAGGGGAAWSFDGGQSWEPADGGRDRHYTWALAVDPADPDCWYVSASTGPGAAHRVGRASAEIYRWRGEGPWQQLADGLPRPLDAMPYALLAIADGVYAGLADGRLFRSGGAGETWNELRVGGEGVPRFLALAAA